MRKLESYRLRVDAAWVVVRELDCCDGDVVAMLEGFYYTERQVVRHCVVDRVCLDGCEGFRNAVLLLVSGEQAVGPIHDPTINRLSRALRLVSRNEAPLMVTVPFKLLVDQVVVVPAEVFEREHDRTVR